MRLKSPTGSLKRLPLRTVGRALVAALLLSAICWFFGVDVWHSLLLGGAIATAGVTGFALATAEIRLESPSSRRHTKQAGSRDDISDLSWLLKGQWGRVGLTAELRVRRIARGRLALQHLDLQRPEDRRAIERLIGPGAYGLLVRIGNRNLSRRELVYCLDALDAIDPTYYPVPARRARRLTLSFIQPVWRRGQ